MVPTRWIGLATALGALAVGCGAAPAAPLDVPAADAPVATDMGPGGDAADGAPPDDAPAPTDGPTTDGPVGPLPNLIPVITGMLPSGQRIAAPAVQQATFNATACEVQEGCTLPGNRRLLRFDLYTPNIGEGDLYTGPPMRDSRTDPRYEWGGCHRHWHLRGYAEYRLLNMDGSVAAPGHKQSFCLEDTGRWLPDAPMYTSLEQHNCDDQGIHAGWFDLYYRSLACQYVDITDVPPGTYRLRARINTDHLVAESSYDDNSTEVVVTIPDSGADAGVPASTSPTEACATTQAGELRNCGWSQEAAPRRCTAGQVVEVGCNDQAPALLGSCVADAMLRVCDGAAPCTDLTALAQNNDFAGTDCPYVRFTCPAGGTYSVMTAAYISGMVAMCRAETRCNGGPCPP